MTATELVDMVKTDGAQITLTPRGRLAERHGWSD